MTTVSVQNHESCPDLSRQFIPISAKLRVKLELKEKNFLFHNVLTTHGSRCEVMLIDTERTIIFFCLNVISYSVISKPNSLNKVLKL